MIPHEYTECRPAILDPYGRRLAEDDPILQVVMAAWAEEPAAVRQAWHEVCCHNSRRADHMALALGFSRRIEAILNREGGV
jgi:hypothetical protein